MATKPLTPADQDKRLPFVVSVPDPMRSFANDGAGVRLLALLVLKIPAVSVLLVAAYRWLR
jgi:hypothetical protein